MRATAVASCVRCFHVLGCMFASSHQVMHRSAERGRVHIGLGMAGAGPLHAPELGGLPCGRNRNTLDISESKQKHATSGGDCVSWCLQPTHACVLSLLVWAAVCAAKAGVWGHCTEASVRRPVFAAQLNMMYRSVPNVLLWLFPLPSLCCGMSTGQQRCTTPKWSPRCARTTCWAISQLCPQQ